MNGSASHAAKVLSWTTSTAHQKSSLRSRRFVPLFANAPSRRTAHCASRTLARLLANRVTVITLLSADIMLRAIASSFSTWLASSTLRIGSLSPLCLPRWRESIRRRISREDGRFFPEVARRAPRVCGLRLDAVGWLRCGRTSDRAEKSRLRQPAARLRWTPHRATLRLWWKGRRRMKLRRRVYLPARSSGLHFVTSRRLLLR